MKALADDNDTVELLAFRFMYSH
ncbi:hypothetical protein NTGM5_760005 [Candidatus Nitrotoga sp. M5]|nr:hypothetical protein NTGM5_760005 [Candidatus Nitrotoga sp. M5]